MTASELLDRIENGETPWPQKIRVVDVWEDQWVELISGRRTFWPFDDGSVAEADLIVFWREGKRDGQPELRLITHVWTHDGIAPGWAIASLRPVKLVAG